MKSLLKAVPLALSLCAGTSVMAQTTTKPNILVIWGDDIGVWNVSAYNRGSMGYKTPNIDRIGKEGAIFSDHYGQPSCTAGRAAFITGQLPIRSGMTTVGLPGAALGLKKESATLAEVLKVQGYATGQFGKNHLGDRNEHLPTVHGFDEFMGNLYHLNVSEEPEMDGYPTDPAFRAKYMPRGVLHCKATAAEPAAEDPRYGKWGKQECVDTGQLTKARMERVDEEFIEGASKFMEKSVADKKPFFMWLNPTRMHVFTHTPAAYRERCRTITSGDDPHCAGMLQHDENIGTVLKKLDDLGISKDTIVIYSTDNGPEHSTWPHGATTPYRSEKMTTWEGSVRVPMVLRWPGRVQPGTELNGIQSHEDLFVTLAAAAGATDIKERLAKGDDLGTGVVKRNYLDGVNNIDYWTGKSDRSSRDHFIYYAEDHLQAIRLNQWKLHFATRDSYYGSTTRLDVPSVFNLRQDPFESYDQAPGPRAYTTQSHTYVGYQLQDIIESHVKSLAAYPPAQRGTSLSMDVQIQQMTRTKQ